MKHLARSANNRGFTLIELLVVIAIVGLLAAVVLVSLQSARVKGRDGKRKSDLSQFAKALDFYYDKYGVYPCGDANYSPDFTLDSSGSMPFLNGTGGLTVTNCIGQPTFGLFEAKVIAQELPPDPINKDVYYYWYQATGDRQFYVLSALMEEDNKAAQTDGGFCSRLFEIGTGVGIIEPYTWTTPCN